MKKKNRALKLLTFFMVFMVFALSPQIVFGDPGLGLATPAVSSVTIDGFPFTYKSSFRVYNTGDEESIFVIRVVVPYRDINEWVSVDTPIFSLKPQENRVVHFNVTADEGYTGSYEILFLPTLLPSKEMDLGGMVVYLGLSGLFRFTVVVPEDVGNLSLGERPPEPEEEEVEEDLTRQIGEVEDSEGGVVAVPLGVVISLELPSREVYKYRVYDVSVSFVGGGEPVGLGFVFVSPSEKQFRCPMTSSFIFDELGEWVVLVVIEDQMILGKTITVKYSLLDDLVHEILPRYGLLIASPFLAAIIIIFMVRRRDKKNANSKKAHNSVRGES